MRQLATIAIPAILALFLTAGFFKGDPRLASLPIDLTVAAGALTALICLFAFFKGGCKLPAHFGWVGPLFVLFALPLLWTEWAAYPSEKCVKLFTFTLLAALAPPLLLRSRKDLWWFLTILAGLGLVMSVEAVTGLAGTEQQRLSAFGSNTIALGRGAAIPLLWGAILLLERRVSPLIAMPLIGVSGLVLLGSGSRGPLLSTFAILLVLGVGFYRQRIARALPIFVAGALLLVTTEFLPSELLPRGSLWRVQTFLQGELGHSELARISFYESAFEQIQARPLGIGWGGFATQLGTAGGQSREYPHNILLETTLEAGWAAGIFLLGFVLAALRRAVQPGAERRAVLALTLFYFANALVSGDINDNKLLFALLALAVAAPAEAAWRGRRLRRLSGFRSARIATKWEVHHA